MSFVHLHLHSNFSLLDSTIRFEELFQFAVEDKMQAMGLTDHGNMFAALEFYTQAKEHGIKPIIGCEVYLAPGSRLLKNTPVTDDETPPYATSRSGLHHLILLCQNEIGYRNLCHLVSLGFLEGFYYKPRIDKEILAKYSEGLIATSACLKGEVTHQALIGDMDRAREAIQWYQNVFKDRFYLELEQNGVPQQMLVNQRFQELAESLKVPLLATADCHYLKKEDAFSQEILMAIEMGKTVEDPSGANLRTDEFYVKPQHVMEQEFTFCPEAIENSVKIANQCNFEFTFNDSKGKKIYHFPKFDPPQGKTAPDFLIDKAKEGLLHRFDELGIQTPEAQKPYFERLDRELQVINDMGFTGYFLIVSDFISYAKDHGIPVGPGRGSGAGSLVAYTLRITELDPLEHGLLFERFLNPERISLPDFDVDFCMDKRDQVIKYVVDKYGKDCVAQIITFGKLQARGVIRDVGRAFGMAASDVDKIAKLVPEGPAVTLEEAFTAEVRLRELTEKDPKMHQLFEVCRSLEGLGRHASIHAAGLVISNRPMVEHCPLYRGKNDELVIQYDMNNADRIGLIKFDFLGLKTLTFLERAQELVNRRHPEAKLDINRINLADKPTYDMLAKGDTNGVFQLESSGMQDLLKKAPPDRFGDIVAIISLYRPGPMEMLPDFIGRKLGQIPILYDFEELRPILSETYGVMVYQEQVQRIAMVLASYTAGGADLLRRAMGKKKPEEMAKQKTIFVAGAVKNGHDQAKAEKLFDLMAKFAGYGFNKSHAAAYSVVTCQTAYLKANYTPEFFAALLSIERENTDKITKYISDARKHNIEVLRPDVNESDSDFTIINDQQIRFGLGAIKGVGLIAIDEIVNTRNKGGPYKDLFDLCSRCNTRIVNKRVLESLIKAGAFDGFKIHRAAQIAAIDSALEMGSSLQKSKDDNQNSFLDLLGFEDTSFDQRRVTYPDEPVWPRLVEFKYEKDVTGFYITGHPLDEFEKEILTYTTATVQDCHSAGIQKEVFLGVTVATLREILTKAKNERMAFVTFEDKTGQIEAVVFPDMYVENELTWKCGEPLWVKGAIETQEGGNKLILSKKGNAKVLPLRHAYEALGRELHIHVEPPPNPTASSVTPNTLNDLQKFLQSVHDRSGSPVFLHVGHTEKASTVLRLKETVPLNRQVVETLKGLMKGTRIEFR